MTTERDAAHLLRIAADAISRAQDADDNPEYQAQQIAKAARWLADAQNAAGSTPTAPRAAQTQETPIGLTTELGRALGLLLCAVPHGGYFAKADPNGIGPNVGKSVDQAKAKGNDAIRAFHAWQEAATKPGATISPEKADQLADVITAVLHQLCTDSDLDNVTAAGGYRQLADMCRAALIGTPYAYLAGNDFALDDDRPRLATLHTAAPDLLAACKLLAAHCELDNRYPAAVEAARAAIRKAEAR